MLKINNNFFILSRSQAVKKPEAANMHHRSNDTMHSIMMNQSPDVTMEMESDQNNNNENSSNNNLKKNEKYSLRQRGQRKSIVNKQQKNEKRGVERKLNSMSDDLMAIESSSPVMIEKVRSVKEKPKQKAAPLSKYRRKTANARERTRMREINHAFESLRQSVPVVVAGLPSQSTNEKLTKITTLRMAMKYIKILSDILDNKTQVTDNLLASLMQVDADGKHAGVSAIPEDDGDQFVANALASNHHDYCKEMEIVKPVKASKITKKVTVKAKKSPTKTRAPVKSKQQQQPHQQKQKVTPLAPPVTSISRKQATTVIQGGGNKFINQLISGNFSNKFDLSQCLTPPNDDCPSELGLILESDGESLQLSEPCFSPLEFGLLLESDGESLHLSEPCLSPLSHLDAFNSINDLLHGGFNDHNSLEMYLS